MRSTRLGLFGVVALAALASAQSPQSQLDVQVAAPADSALARTEAAMANEQLAIASVAGGVVTAKYTDGMITVEISATVIPVDASHARVVITGFGSAPAAFGIPATRTQVTSKTGGKGKKAWARMEQLAAALAPAAS